MLESCTLADTGMAQNTLLIIAATIVVLGIGLLFAGKRYGFRGSFLTVLFVFVAVLFLSVKPASAQNANCDPEATEETVSLRLVNDTYAGTPGETLYAPVVANDLFPNGDLIDWYSLDLIPETEEIDTFTYIYHPNDPTLRCGYAYFEHDVTGEEIEIYIESTCYDDDSNTFPLVSPLTFGYTAKTQSGVKAPAPATVTIILEGVYAFDHTIYLNHTLTADANVASDAVTFVGTINSDSVDLDPSTPGRQTTLTITDIATPDVDLTLEVDSTGLVTATLTGEGDLTCQSGGLGSFPYTIQNSAFTVSNEANIEITYNFDCA